MGPSSNPLLILSSLYIVTNTTPTSASTLTSVNSWASTGLVPNGTTCISALILLGRISRLTNYHVQAATSNVIGLIITELHIGRYVFHKYEKPERNKMPMGLDALLDILPDKTNIHVQVAL